MSNVYLQPPPQDVEIANAFHNEFMGQTAHQDVHVISTWELDAQEALALDNPALLPFIPLMKGDTSQQTLQSCIRKIRQEPDADELSAMIATFASLVMNVDLLKRVWRWNMLSLIEETLLFQEVFGEALERRTEEAREEARKETRKALLTTLHHILLRRFDVADDYIDDERFGELEPEVIQKLMDAALDSESLQEFETHIHTTKGTGRINR